MTIWLGVGVSFALAAGIQPYVPFGRIGTLIRYHGLPFVPVRTAVAMITWIR